MVEFLKFATNMMNDFHDITIALFDKEMYPNIDKWLHFVVVAAVGMVIFVFVYALFKLLSKYGIAAMSFVYTFTIVTILAVAIEIQQGITGRGHVSLSDVLWGVCGFVCVFALCAAMKNICTKLKERKNLK